jgi:hypothetical protein
MRGPARPIVMIATLLALAAIAAPAGAAPDPEVGRDISYPQCATGSPHRHEASYAVLGVNGGRAFTENPCLVAQLRWAKRLPGAPAFYANTGNPGPRLAKHWPLGQATPYICSAADPNSLGCSYDYGWNAAQQSFAVAARAAQRLHHVSAEEARLRAANVDWWLDVEISNSWQTLIHGHTRPAQLRDSAALGGAVNALWGIGVQRVGIYSTRYQWTQITGGRAVTQSWFRSLPVWLAGFNGRDGATAGCSAASFTGGEVLMTQYLAHDGFDGDVWCSTDG